MVRVLESLTDRVAYWTGICVMVLVSAFTFLIAAMVFLRYGLGMGLDWGEELARYLMIWMGFLAASLAVRSGAHVGLTLFRDALPRPLRRLVVSLGAALMVALFAVVVHQGFRLVILVWAQESLALPISMSWPYLAIPVGTLLMLLQSLPSVLRQVTGRGPDAASTGREGSGGVL